MKTKEEIGNPRNLIAELSLCPKEKNQRGKKSKEGLSWMVVLDFVWVL